MAYRYVGFFPKNGCFTNQFLAYSKKTTHNAHCIHLIKKAESQTMTLFKPNTPKKTNKKNVCFKIIQQIQYVHCFPYCPTTMPFY